MSNIKETMCDSCFDVSSLDEPFYDGMCMPCYRANAVVYRDLDFDTMESRMADAEMGDL